MSSPDDAPEEFAGAPDTPAWRRVRASALWAAWGDAVGFITELASSTTVISKRAGASRVVDTIDWERRVGGRFGPTVQLPAGTYSDDTQLRLATARCIRPSGRFDIETFSKVELPVFLSYELGAGRGTKAAAAALSRRSIRWSSNFFDEDRARYLDGGGNGAAMRIQPHVWAAPDYHPDRFLVPVLMNAVATHGHPRGFVGAALHAVSLASCLRAGAVPEPGSWASLLEFLTKLPSYVALDETLRDRWRPMWEARTGRPLDGAIDETVQEALAIVDRPDLFLESLDPETTYRNLAREIGGTQPATRGSGMVSSLLALAAAWLFRDDPRRGVEVVANVLGSDTDTIASMAGALLGAATGADSAGQLQDRDYIVQDAKRLWQLSRGEQTKAFPHPDVLKWQAPATQLDAVGTLGDRLAVAGLGVAEEVGAPHYGSQKDRGAWQWLRLHYGQTLLVKRRRRPAPLPAGAQPVERPPSAIATPRARGGSLRPLRAAAPASPSLAEIDRLIDSIATRQFDPTEIGQLLLMLADDDERGASLAAAAAVRLAERRQRNRRHR